MEVPTATKLADIYSKDAVEEQSRRWENLLAKFKEQYGRDAEFVSRCPGRVNLIGEHIDYSLYEVLPMAVTVDVILAVAVDTKSQGPSKVRIANVENSKFPDREFDIPARGEIEIDAEVNEWSNYFKAGLRGVSGMLSEQRGEDFVSVSMDIMVDGTVPSGGGLSSSAAFVCASSLAVLKANGEEKVDKKELVELAIVSERAVGVNSGGMDQSASVFGERGSSLYVSFKPTLKITPAPIPDTNPAFVVLVAQSFVAADKHVAAPVQYNLRVVECSLAAAFLAKIFGLKRGLPKDQGPLGISLRGFHDTFFEDKEGITDNTQVESEVFEQQLTRLATIVEDYLPQEDGYSREEISDMLDISVEDLNERYTSKVPVRAEKFMLRQRTLHVFKEALRVIQFRSLLQAPPDDSLPKSLGDIMNATQDSCRDLYDCSCPELDELCEIARSAGAYGSRLTGAGWGGCTVHLVPKDKVERVKEALEDKYYRKRFPDITEKKLQQAIVVSEPGSGAFLYAVQAGSIA